MLMLFGSTRRTATESSSVTPADDDLAAARRPGHLPPLAVRWSIVDPTVAEIGAERLKRAEQRLQQREQREQQRKEDAGANSGASSAASSASLSNN